MFSRNVFMFSYYIYTYIYMIYVHIHITHSLVNLVCLEHEIPHKLRVNQKFWEWKCQDKTKKLIACGCRKKISHICSYIDYFSEIIAWFWSQKSSLKYQKNRKVCQIEVFSMMSWPIYCFVSTLALKIHFNLDFVLKSFRCSKGDVSRVLLKTLWNGPTKLL